MNNYSILIESVTSIFSKLKKDRWIVTQLSSIYYNILFSDCSNSPAPTVRPPSRIENLVPSSIAIGAISSTVISMLSPGITISTPSGRLITPVTSVVRK